MLFVCLLPVCNSVCGVFQVSASRSEIEEAEENAVYNHQAEERTEEGLFDMVTASMGLLTEVDSEINKELEKQLA